MKSIIALGAGLLASSSLWAMSSDTLTTRTGQTVYAEVVDARPIIEVVRERSTAHVCRHVETPAGPQSATPPIVGGIIGGVIGNQFGSGRGRTLSTVAGAALGGAVGLDHARKNRPPATVMERCEPEASVREYERVVGYRVTYRYNGELHVIETDEHPGDRLALEVQLAPA